MKIEGYWNNTANRYPEYPMPVQADEPFENKCEILKLLTTAENRAVVNHYRGWSNCRCCGTHNGSTEFALGGWLWPEGFRHYVEVHNVKPTDEFLKEVLGL